LTGKWSMTPCSQLVTATFDVGLQSSEGVEVGVDSLTTPTAAAAAVAVALNSYELHVAQSNVAPEHHCLAVRRLVVAIPDHLSAPHGMLLTLFHAQQTDALISYSPAIHTAQK